MKLDIVNNILNPLGEIICRVFPISLTAFPHMEYPRLIKDLQFIANFIEFVSVRAIC